MSQIVGYYPGSGSYYTDSMSSITFDALKFARRLKEAGVPDGQAEAEAAALADAFAEALESQLATKSDIAKVERELLLIKWMVGLVIAAEAFPLLKALFA